MSELSGRNGTFMIPLRRVAALEVRYPGEQTWTAMELAPLLEAEPERCDGV